MFISSISRVSIVSVTQIAWFKFSLESYLLENDEWKFDTMPEIMDGKNVADFVDPDIEEKLEALEREEERLAEEGFYDEHSDLRLDSEDEREAEALEAAKQKRLESQATKKSMKNAARLPRTAGLRTLSDLSTELAKAGYDPSRIQARAELIAKVQGLKRKRAEESRMDVDEDIDSDDDVDRMDVDGEEMPMQKRTKSEKTDAVVLHSRAPRKNRQLAGLRDDQVRFQLLLTPLSPSHSSRDYSKLQEH